jgi:hypothetical protein
MRGSKKYALLCPESWISACNSNESSHYDLQCNKEALDAHNINPSHSQVLVYPPHIQRLVSLEKLGRKHSSWKTGLLK